MASYEEYIEVNSGTKHSVLFYHDMVYQFEDGSIEHVVPSSAWCFDCQGLVMAEHLDSPDVIESTRQMLLSIIAGSSEYINHFFWPVPPTTSDVERELNRLEQYWTKHSRRVSPERCLVCGGTNIQKTNWRHDEITALPNGMVLRCVSSGFADAGVEPKIVLNAEGLRDD